MLDKPNPQTKSKTRRKPGYDFVSPFSLEECVYWLQSQAGRTHRIKEYNSTPDYKLKVEVQPIDSDTYTVSMKWCGYHRFEASDVTAEAGFKGYLKRWDNDCTYVTGRGYTAKGQKRVVFKILLVDLVLVIYAVIVSLSMSGASSCTSGFVVLYVISTMSGAIGVAALQSRLRDMLYDLISRDLGDPEYLNLGN